MRAEESFTGCHVNGERYDIGKPAAYRQTLIDYANVKNTIHEFVARIQYNKTYLPIINTGK